MAGGLLNLVAIGNQNVILTGNPSKTFFKTTYKKYTNFGLQKFRIDVNGSRNISMSQPSTFTFKIPRYADLLMDTYLAFTLPTIWSPIVPPKECTDQNDSTVSAEWKPYEFKWIDNLGSQLIKNVRFSIGGQIIQEFTGEYLYNFVERDFDNAKKDLYYKMTGNTAEFNNPAYNNGRIGIYPSVYYTNNLRGPDPSIRAKTLYIPLNIWFTLAAKMAFPLVCLQYNELHIEIEIRPVKELFVIRNVIGQGAWYHQPNFSSTYDEFYCFLQPPPSVELNKASYTDQRTNWNADIHLISTYAFLTDDEVRVFASQTQQYLIKEVYQYRFQNVVGSTRKKLDSLGLVIDWMWYFRRSDANLRNEWSNYTNWPYNYLPYNVVNPVDGGPFYKVGANGSIAQVYNKPYTPSAVDCSAVFPSNNPGNGSETAIFITPLYTPQNNKDIMTKWGLLLDGKYRENVLDVGVWEYIEKYVRTKGNGQDGLYCYNFCLNTDPMDFQPSGAINMSKFSTIEFELSTISPPMDASAQVLTVCDGNGNIIGINKNSWNIFEYSYDLTVFEERYNILTFMSGTAGLEFAR